MAISGKTGSVTWASSELCAHSWTIDVQGDRLDASSFCTNGKKEYVIGLTGATASVESHAFVDFDPTVLVSVILANDDVIFSGSAYVNLNVTTPVEGLVDYTYDVQYTGNVTVAPIEP